MLFELYTRLAQAFPASCDHLYGEPINEQLDVWLAVDQELFPSLLFPATRGDDRSDIALRSIDVEFSRECAIASEGVPSCVGIYSIIRLNDNDPDIIRVFLRLLEEAFCQPVQRLTNREVGDRILELAELFGRVEAGGDVIGLWGELYLISVAKNSIEAVRCWCSHKKAKHDFVSDAFAIEVKTSLKPTRQHRFSIEQLRPGAGFEVYVASVLVTEAQGGRTAAEILEEIYATIPDPKLREAFFGQCLRKGGRDIYRSGLRLRPFPDATSLAIYDARHIPVPTVEPSSPITSVRFDVDLSQLAPLDPGARTRVLLFTAGSRSRRSSLDDRVAAEP